MRRKVTPVARAGYFFFSFQERNFFLLAFIFLFFPPPWTAEPTADAGHRTSLDFFFPFPKRDKRVKKEKREKAREKKVVWDKLERKDKKRDDIIQTKRNII